MSSKGVRGSARKLRAVPALMLGAAALSSQCFVPSPSRSSQIVPVTMTGALLAQMQAAQAVLPPLEDLPMEQVNPNFDELQKASEETVFGISFENMLFAIAFAVTWAATWAFNTKPAKDSEGTYKTYVGLGGLPPEGYTNPLDARMVEEEEDEDDDLYKKGDVDLTSALEAGPKGKRSASSAIV